jgi:hypothetical protein
MRKVMRNALEYIQPTGPTIVNRVSWLLSTFKLVPVILFTFSLLPSCMAGTPGADSAEARPVDQVILINEILASNTSTNDDPDYSSFSDWIEIHNAGDQPVDLRGFYLTDNLNTSTKWQIPNSTIVPPLGFVLFWADRKDESRHTNFSLDRNGEDIGLFAPDGTLVDAISFQSQMPDVSFGRQPGKGSEWAYFYPPSPNAANNSRRILEKTTTAPPRFSLPGGFYSESQDLELKAPSPLALIRYTLDGSTPTSASPLYRSPIHIDSTTVVRASAFQAGYLQSPVVNRTYFIDEAVTLPVVSMMADPQSLWDSEMGIYVNENVWLRKEWERPVHLQFFENDGTQGFSADASIRLFGHTAIELPQKSLAVFIQSADGMDTIHYSLFPGRPVDEFGSFILRSSSDDWDQTMFRDAMAQQLLREHFALDTQLYRPAILFLNGEYFGIHNIREKYNEDLISTQYGVNAYDTDLLSIHRGRASGEETIEVLHGLGADYEAMMDFIATHGMRVSGNYAYVQSQVDVDNFIDYIIAEIYVNNTSWHRNRKIWRDKTSSGKWTFLIYDLDRGFDDPQANLLAELVSHDLLFGALLENDEFTAKFIRRFFNHLHTAYRPPRVIATIDRLRAGIEPEMPRHIARWKDECTASACGIQSMDAWEDEIETMREFARQRPAYVRQHLVEQFGSGGTAKLVLNIFEPGGGRVLINDLPVAQDLFTYTYLQDIPLELTAIPNPGYRFLGWQEIHRNSNPTSITLSRDLTITAMFAPIEQPNRILGAGIPAGLLVLSLFIGWSQLARWRRAH